MGLVGYAKNGMIAFKVMNACVPGVEQIMEASRRIADLWISSSVEFCSTFTITTLGVKPWVMGRMGGACWRSVSEGKHDVPCSELPH